MKIRELLMSLTVVLFLAPALAAGADADKAKKQAEIRKATNSALERFYKADPKLKGAVAKAPGYAVFTSFGLSFFIGGAGGSGLAHDAATRKDIYMHMAQASAGLQIGAAESETLIIFKSPKALSTFESRGWEFGGGATAGAGAGGKAVNTNSPGENVIDDAFYYTLTKNGLQAGGAVAGTKFWKDKDLN